MEVVKIIAIVLVVEIFVYYLFTVITKYSNGERSADIWNIFFSWRNAGYRQNWEAGYQAHEEHVQEVLKKVGWVDKYENPSKSG